MRLQLKKSHLAADARTLFDMDVACFNRTFDFPPQSVNILKEYLTGSIIYLCLDNDRPVGAFCYKGNNEDEVELMQFMVLPEYQGKGVGKYMLRKFLEYVKGKNIHVVTHPLNTPALVLYLKHGFCINGWKDNYYGDGEPRLELKYGK